MQYREELDCAIAAQDYGLAELGYGAAREYQASSIYHHSLFLHCHFFPFFSASSLFCLLFILKIYTKSLSLTEEETDKKALSIPICTDSAPEPLTSSCATSFTMASIILENFSDCFLGVFMLISR